MILKPESGISPIIGVILLIFLTVVLIGGTALIVFGFAGDIPEAKNTYITAEGTDNTSEPLAIHIWNLGNRIELKNLVVSVNTPDGVSTGTPSSIHNDFFVGEIVPIGFDKGFPKGSYFVTVTGEFVDGTTQVLFTKTMDLEAEGQAIHEVSTEKLILQATYATNKPTRIGLEDITPYTNITNISYWTLDLGYTGAVTEVLLVPVNDYYVYPSEAFAGSAEKEFVITYTAYYTNGKTKTTVEIKIKLYTSVPEDTIGKYVGNYKIGGESLQGTGDSSHHIRLIGTLSTEIWREDILGRYIEKDGVDYPALQINLNDEKEGASSVTITCDTDFVIKKPWPLPGVPYNSGETYVGNFTNFYLNTTGTSSINVILKVYDVNNTKLAEQTTEIIIKE